MKGERMKDTFDPHTSDDPFRRRQPQLPTEATEREVELADRYTRVSYCVVSDPNKANAVIPDATIAWFVVDAQAFEIRCCDTRQAAAWWCWMFVKALVGVLTTEEERQSA
jgi:hypothetical protein